MIAGEYFMQVGRLLSRSYDACSSLSDQSFVLRTPQKVYCIEFVSLCCIFGMLAVFFLTVNNYVGSVFV